MRRLTLAEVLSLDIMVPATVLAAEQETAHRWVDWISVIESPVEDFVRRDELVLTTGMGCGHDSRALLRFVEDVMHEGAAGLAVALGPHVPTINEEIIGAADEWHFPLMTLPWEVRFSDITRRVFREISLNPSTRTSLADPTRRLLWGLAQGDDLNAIVESVGRLCNASCAFFRAQNGQWYGARSTITECVVQFGALKPLRQLLYDIPPTDEPIHLEGLDLLPVRSMGRWFGTLAIQRGAYKDMESTFHRWDLVSHILALTITTEDMSTEAERHIQEDFVWRLAKGEFGNWEDLLTAAGPLKTTVSQFSACVVGRIENLNNLYRYTQTIFHAQSPEQLESSIVSIVQHTLRTAALQKNYGLLVTYQHEEWIAYFLSTKRIDYLVIQHCLDEVNKAVGVQWPQIILSWGIASGSPSVKGFHQSCLNARMGLERGVRREGGGGQFTYEDIQHTHMFERLREDNSMREVVESTMRDLVGYDRQHHTDLVETLKSYLHNRTNVSLTARTLHLHRQSLLYRLKKIEALTGRSLDNTDDLFLLELCVRIFTLTSS